MNPINIEIALWIWVALFLFRFSMLLYANIFKAGTIYNNRNEIVDNFRSEYGVPVKTFYDNVRLGFTTTGAIYINQRLFPSRRLSIQKEKEITKQLKRSLLHEYYHFKHNHPIKRILYLLLADLLVIPMGFIPWGIPAGVWLVVAYVVQGQFRAFERRATKYAEEMLNTPT